MRWILRNIVHDLAPLFSFGLHIAPIVVLEFQWTFICNETFMVIKRGRIHVAELFLGSH